jgi:hypothetical protein
MAQYQKGDSVRLTWSTSDLNGVPMDPTAVILYVLTPANVLTSYTLAGGAVTKDSTGEFHYDLVLNEGGVWRYRWVATGAVTAASEDTRIDVQYTAL